jgi:bacteriocin-like protein
MQRAAREAKACKSPEEMIELAKREGYKLSDEELENVSGGAWSESTDDGECPHYSHATGDEREDVDPAQVPADFANGSVDGGEDW